MMETKAATVYIWQNRCTKEFIDAGERFTVAALPESCRKALGYMGAHSGYDGDKWQPVGLTPMEVEGTAAPEEAEVILVCRKLLAVDLTEATFLDLAMKARWYSGGDEGNFHTIYKQKRFEVRQILKELYQRKKIERKRGENAQSIKQVCWGIYG